MDSVSSRPAGGHLARRQARATAHAETVARIDTSLPPAERTDDPVLVVFCGVPGSGKSYLARRLQPRLAALIVESDHIRHVLFPAPCYTAVENGRVYTVCHDLIARRLGQRQSVIFDATNLLEQGRRRLSAIALRSGARFVLVHTVAPDAVIRQRIQHRGDAANHSDADIAVYEALRQTEQPIRHQHIVIDTTQDCEQAIARILSECDAKDQATDPDALSFAVLDHTADLAIRVWGRSLEELFANAAAAMFAQMADLGHASVSSERAVSVEGDDTESLLVAWLSELLYLREVRREAYLCFDVRFPAPGVLAAVAGGCPWPAFDRPVKAVTYHNLKITHTAGRYETTIVFDV